MYLSMMCEIREKIRNTLMPLNYPSTSITSPSTVGYAYLTAGKDLPEFDPNIHNAVMFDQMVRPLTGSDIAVQYSIPQIGEFCLQFRLSTDSSRVTFDVNGVVVSKWNDLRSGVWYDLFECPVNLFAAPYGQRFLIVDYSTEGSRDVTFGYLSTDEKTRQDAVDKSRSI